MSGGSQGDILIVRLPVPLDQRDRRRVFQTVFESTYDDFIDELSWSSDCTELRIASASPINEFPNDSLDDLARRVEGAVPLEPGSVRVERRRVK